MVGDGFRDRWAPKIPEWFPDGLPPTSAPVIPPDTGRPLPYAPNWPAPVITRKEFEDLKKEVELLAELLKRAVAYDEANGEPACETDEKMALLRAIAKAVGVELPV